MPTCAFLTTDDLTGYVTDDERAVAPLARRDWRVAWVPWRAAAEWSSYDRVVIRTPWDYLADPDGFLEVLAAIEAAGTPLDNPLRLVRWNLRKTYLEALEAAGVPVVPTVFGHGLSGADVRTAADRLGTADLVVKPVVGANAVDTFRLRFDRPGGVRAEVRERFRGRSVLIQPFLPSVLEAGERSVVLVDGEPSHALVKVPRGGDFRSQEEHGADVRAAALDDDATSLARAALAAAPGPPPLYARVDMLADAGGRLRVSELELIEPSLYLRLDDAAADRFAAAIAARGGDPGAGRSVAP